MYGVILVVKTSSVAFWTGVPLPRTSSNDASDIRLISCLNAILFREVKRGTEDKMGIKQSLPFGCP